MTTRDEPLDPQEVLEAAEAAHLAARHTVSISPGETSEEVAEDVEPDQGAEPDPHLTVALDRETVALDPPATRGLDRETVGLDRETVSLDRETVSLDRETVRVPRQRAGGEQRSRPPLPLAAGVAALWAVVITFVPVAVVVTLLLAADAEAVTFGGSLRVAAAGWLLAHGVPLDTAAGPVGLAPLALSVLAGWRVVRAGVHVTRARGARDTGSVGQALLVAVAVALGYGVIGLLMGVIAGGPGWGPQLPRAGLTLAGFGFLAAAYGSFRATGALGPLLRRTPLVLREGGRGGLVAAAGLLADGAATAGTALAVSGGPAAELLSAYGTGVAGQAGLTLLCLAYAPNLAGWAAAYLVGPGFAVGAGTLVRSSEVMIGPLPALPVFAGLPSGPLPSVGAALLVAPVLAGGVGGWLLARRISGGGGGTLPPDRTAWVRLALGALVVGVVAGLVLGAVAFGSGGPLGGGQLATLGPDPALVALSSAATATVGALLGAAIGVGSAGRRRVP